ncbi:hypothetical protein BDF14DRAFT_1761253 [Spinellus fusiger]|nr:hypothetical protein BDF14DRAFT_1761253 [Spinellus fusiger]
MSNEKPFLLLCSLSLLALQWLGANSQAYNKSKEIQPFPSILCGLTFKPHLHSSQIVASLFFFPSFLPSKLLIFLEHAAFVQGYLKSTTAVLIIADSLLFFLPPVFCRPPSPIKLPPSPPPPISISSAMSFAVVVVCLFLVSFPYVHTQKTGNSCVLLQDSRACPAFQQFYVGIAGLSTQYPFMTNVTSVEAFDQSLFNYVNSTSYYLFPLGCLSSNYNPTVPYARYSLSSLCALMIQDPKGSLPCNYQYNLIPPPLCRSTCDDWASSLRDITSEPSVCSDSLQRNTTLDSLELRCTSWQGYNGTSNTNCISGIANEPENCGFQNNTANACSYCTTHSSDTCCQRLKGCYTHLSAGSIAGSVVGSVVGAVLMGGLVYCCFRHTRTEKYLYRNPHPAQRLSVCENLSTSQQGLVVHSVSDGFPPPPPPLPLTEPPSSFFPPEPPVHGDLVEETIVSPCQSLSIDAFHIVIHSYPPQLEDELSLSIGDVVCLALSFDDGWAFGFNMTSGHQGVFPMICIAPAPPDLLDQSVLVPDPAGHTKIQYENSMHKYQDRYQEREEYHFRERDASSRSQKEAALTIKQLHEDLKRSLSLGVFSTPKTRRKHTSHTMPSRTTTPTPRASPFNSSMTSTHPPLPAFHIPLSVTESSLFNVTSGQENKNTAEQ